jgi:hypothetical protein
VAVTILAQFLSFTSLEINRFIAIDDAGRVLFFFRHLWLVPVAAVVWLAGILQPLWMVREWLRRSAAYEEWSAMRTLMAATVLIVYASYWVVLEPSQAHAFYVVAPAAFMFVAYCWTLIDSPAWRRIAASVLVLNIVFHAALAWIQWPQRSLYRNRDVVSAAIQLKQPEMIAHRRPFAVDSGPLSLTDQSRPYDMARDVEVLNTVCIVDRGGVIVWRLTVRNTNQRVAFRDVLYETTYRDRTGRVIEQRHQLVKQVFEPNESVALEISDGFAISDAETALASFGLLAAEALLPVPLEYSASRDAHVGRSESDISWPVPMPIAAKAVGMPTRVSLSALSPRAW